ncbi:polysaccharide deacetylase family protein [Kytococcus sedentarius]|uniref:polysaccharide deacetylase family protein n=1 Tax=Kytococcus sedentarius TaxID=1276 RepID=UPI00387A57C6
MILRRNARAIARRSLLLGRYGSQRALGRAPQVPRPGGSTILLLHNTLPGDAARLERYIADHREQFVDLDSAIPAAGADRQEPGVALTFDDGFYSNLDMARRLARLDLQACFYVPTDVIGLPKHQSDAFFRRPQAEGVMGWAALEELRSLGHHVGSHCRQHKPLAGTSPAHAEDQVKGSLALLKERLGAADHFAWPFGGLHHAPVADVVRWCREVDALPASGVRGTNTPARLADEGYLRRDAIDLKWLSVDMQVLLGQ